MDIKENIIYTKYKSLEDGEIIGYDRLFGWLRIGNDIESAMKYVEEDVKIRGES